MARSNKFGKIEYMGAMRHKDPMLCTIGAATQYLFWRWHCSGESPPSFWQRRDWYRVKVLHGEKLDGKISYATQYECTWKAFAGACINSVTKTHVMRGCRAQLHELHGVSESQVRPVSLLLKIQAELFGSAFRSDGQGTGSRVPWLGVLDTCACQVPTQSRWLLWHPRRLFPRPGTAEPSKVVTGAGLALD